MATQGESPSPQGKWAKAGIPTEQAGNSYKVKGYELDEPTELNNTPPTEDCKSATGRCRRFWLARDRCDCPFDGPFQCKLDDLEQREREWIQRQEEEARARQYDPEELFCDPQRPWNCEGCPGAIQCAKK